MLWPPLPVAMSGRADLAVFAHNMQRRYRKSTSPFDCAGEEIFDTHALWVPEEADTTGGEQVEKVQRIQSTRDALKRDRHRMKRLMHKIKKRSRHFIASELGVDMSVHRPEGELHCTSFHPV